MLIRDSEFSDCEEGGRGKERDFAHPSSSRFTSWVQAPLQVSSSWKVKRVGDKGQRDWSDDLIKVSGLITARGRAEVDPLVLFVSFRDARPRKQSVSGLGLIPV